MPRWSRSYALWIAALAPLFVLIGVLVFAAFEGARRDVEVVSAQRATEVASLVDASAVSELKLAQVLASSAPLAREDMAEAYRRAAEVMALSGNWRTVVLSDPARGIEVFDLRRPLDGGPRPMADYIAAAAPGLAGPTMSDITRDRLGVYVLPLHVPVVTDRGRRYLLTVELDTAAIQALVTTRAPPGSVVAVVDRSGNFIARNVAYESRVGRPATRYVRDAIAGGRRGLYPGVTYEGFKNYTAFDTGQRTGWSAHVAVASYLVDTPRRMSLAILGVVAVACLGASGGLALVAVRRMRSRRQEEARLHQSQKMEAVGQLTGGIAHDFNNLLTAIIGGLELSLKRAAPGDPSRRYLEGALDAAARGAKLTSRLLAFSRTQRLARERVDVQAVMWGMTDLLEQSLGPRIAMSIDVAEDARWVVTDQNQLELALLNLAVNARDAMPEGGRLELSTRRTPAKGRSSHDRVEIVVADTGQGMTREVAARAFDPFFTTKEVNRGTGLGLAQVYAMARQSDGEAVIESVPGQGTRVRLRLPAAPPPLAGPDDVNARKDAVTASLRRDRRLMVVDDDAGVRGVLVDELRLLGFQVTEAASGAEALAMLERDAPDLMIVDFLMPGLTGADVAVRARELRPGQRIMFVSGHMDNAALDAAAQGAVVLRKPFVVAELAETVGRALDDAEAPQTAPSA
ncbi:MAG: response regulator [Phenylobacterium sp.]|uniref:ATP-binding protein n=1 Tax=Phenylobacterium sp. TaxID=1871053 RepID=UPI001A51D081|nr:ATP-binding protein [Phenylobacterium sp.]MBL8771331.1 response regulator [Phenylobacterium sp.]